MVLPSGIGAPSIEARALLDSRSRLGSAERIGQVHRPPLVRPIDGKRDFGRRRRMIRRIAEYEKIRGELA
jgi:hypothetical protein